MAEFRPISIATRCISEQVAIALVEQARRDGNTDKAARIAKLWDDYVAASPVPAHE